MTVASSVDVELSYVGDGHLVKHFYLMRKKRHLHPLKIRMYEDGSEIAPKAIAMFPQTPFDDPPRRQKLPYEWEVRKARRRRIVGRFLCGLIGLAAIAAIILLSSHR